MQQYLKFLRTIREHGVDKADRTGVGTYSIFGYEMRFDLAVGFPLVTTKKLHLKSIIYELLWMLSGDTRIQYLNDHGVSIWNEWADEQGELGPVYGKQWRCWSGAHKESIDQINVLIEQIKHNPNSRRLIVSAWNVADLPDMALPPCHVMMQFSVVGHTLSCKLTQRSADAFLGVPFNIASYALLTHMIAQQCALKVGDFIWSGGECHIYCNHLTQVETQLGRQPAGKLPQLEIMACPESIDSYDFNHFRFYDYHPHPAIKAPVAV